MLGLVRRGATVISCNSSSGSSWMRSVCLEADMIISCTGSVHLIDETYIRNDQSQVVIDVGWGSRDGKPVGDMTLETMKDKVAAYTPIPGGV